MKERVDKDHAPSAHDEGFNDKRCEVDTFPFELVQSTTDVVLVAAGEGGVDALFDVLADLCWG